MKKSTTTILMTLTMALFMVFSSCQKSDPYDNADRDIGNHHKQNESTVSNTGANQTAGNYSAKDLPCDDGSSSICTYKEWPRIHCEGEACNCWSSKCLVDAGDIIVSAPPIPAHEFQQTLRTIINNGTVQDYFMKDEWRKLFPNPEVFERKGRLQQIRSGKITLAERPNGYSGTPMFFLLNGKSTRDDFSDTEVIFVWDIQ